MPELAHREIERLRRIETAAERVWVSAQPDPGNPSERRVSAEALEALRRALADEPDRGPATAAPAR
jgi:hypothetical protein